MNNMNRKIFVFCIGWIAVVSGCATSSQNPGTQSQAAEASPDPNQAARLQEIAQICRQVACRPETVVRMMVDEKRYFETSVYSSPYVYDGLVSVLSGEQFHLEAEVAPDGQLVNLRHVPQITHPERSLTVSLVQNAENRTHQGMILTVSSGFSGLLRYEAGIMPVGAEGVFGTSTCPVRQGVAAMEMWQDLLLAVHLTGFRILSPNDPEGTSCH